MVRSHGERCKAAELLFSTVFPIIRLPWALVFESISSFARNVEERIMSEVSLYGHSPRAEFGMWPSFLP